MKALLTIFTMLLISFSANAQQNFYFGYENGGLFDRYHYVNSKGKSFIQSSIGGIYGINFGYRSGTYTIESGFYGLYSSMPIVEYDYNTSEVELSLSMSSGKENWLVPLRFGKEFLMMENRLFIKPEIGINLIFARDYAEGKSNMGWATGISFFPGDSIVPGPNSTRAYGYVPSKFNLGIEPSLTAGFRIWKGLDIYMKYSIIASLSPLYYETITHISETETVTATRSMLNSSTFQIGLKYHFKKIE